MLRQTHQGRRQNHRISAIANETAARLGTDVVMYDASPNAGALNRAVSLDCDGVRTSVAADLFFLRALSTVSRSVSGRTSDRHTIKDLANDANESRIFTGLPSDIGSVTSTFKVNTGSSTADSPAGRGGVEHTVAVCHAANLPTREFSPKIVRQSLGETFPARSRRPASRQPALAAPESIKKPRSFPLGDHIQHCDRCPLGNMP